MTVEFLAQLVSMNLDFESFICIKANYTRSSSSRVLSGYDRQMRLTLNSDLKTLLKSPRVREMLLIRELIKNELVTEIDLTVHNY